VVNSFIKPLSSPSIASILSLEYSIPTRTTVDPIFDRLETLLKSLWNPDRDPFAGDRSAEGRVRPSSGDSDYSDAMDELDAFLKDDREGQERLEAERRRRAEEEERRARNRYSSGSAGRTPSSDPSIRLAGDYKILGLSFGAPMSEVKAAYKRLLKQHHPDRHGASPEAQKKATEFSARLNAAYARIETWTSTGKIPE
jgi:hypothetical protein